MSRWKPDTAHRLQEAALSSYGENGYDQTTVAGIARRAGLTERTFYRHYADKREVLFKDAESLEAVLVGVVVAAPHLMAPLETTMAGFDAVAVEFFSEERRNYMRRRQDVVAGTPALIERELAKYTSLVSALTRALVGRGVPNPDARVSAELGVLAFRLAFEEWVSDDGPRELVNLLERSFLDLRRVLCFAS